MSCRIRQCGKQKGCGSVSPQTMTFYLYSSDTRFSTLYSYQPLRFHKRFTQLSFKTPFYFGLSVCLAARFLVGERGHALSVIGSGDIEGRIRMEEMERFEHDFQGLGRHPGWRAEKDQSICMIIFSTKQQNLHRIIFWSGNMGGAWL